MALPTYYQRLYDNIVAEKWDHVAYRLLAQIRSCQVYRKDPNSRRRLHEEIAQLAEVIDEAMKVVDAERDRRWGRHRS